MTGNKRGVRDAKRSKGEGDNLTVVFYSLLNGKRLSGTIWTELYTCMCEQFIVHAPTAIEIRLMSFTKNFYGACRI